MNWTSEQIEFLRKNAGKLSLIKMAESLGVGRWKVLNFLKRERLVGKPACRAVEWTPELVARIKEMGPTHSLNAIARELQIGRVSIQRKAKELGIYRPHPSPLIMPNKWTPEEDAYLLSQGPTVLARVIGEHLGRSASSVHHRSVKLGRTVQIGGNRRTPKEKRPHRFLDKESYSPRRTIRVVERSIDICPKHRCPVSNWEEHKERLGCDALPPYLAEYYARKCA